MTRKDKKMWASVIAGTISGVAISGPLGLLWGPIMGAAVHGWSEGRYPTREYPSKSSSSTTTSSGGGSFLSALHTDLTALGGWFQGGGGGSSSSSPSTTSTSSGSIPSAEQIWSMISSSSKLSALKLFKDKAEFLVAWNNTSETERTKFFKTAQRYLSSETAPK